MVSAFAGTVALGALMPTDAQAGPGVFDGGITITDSGGSQEAINLFELRPRLIEGLAGPVPTLRPGTANKYIAVDIVPNGSPEREPGSGVAHIDICSGDCVASKAATEVARIGIFRPEDDHTAHGHVELGSRNYSGGEYGPDVWLTTNATRPPQIKLVPPREESHPRIEIGSDKSNVLLGSTSGLTLADGSGFTYWSTVKSSEGPGHPTKVPDGYGSTMPVVFNPTDRRLWAYTGGKWRSLFPPVDASNAFTAAQGFYVGGAPAIEIRSSNAEKYGGLSIGRTGPEFYAAVAGAVNHFVTGSQPGDAVLTTASTDQALHIGSGRRVPASIRIQDARLGFFGAAPAARPTIKPPAEATTQEVAEALQALGLVE